jgi:hypothetical protein
MGLSILFEYLVFGLTNNYLKHHSDAIFSKGNFDMTT